MIKVYVGWDSREDFVYRVCEKSLKETASKPIEIVPLRQNDLKNDCLYWREEDKLSSTEFTFTRFLVPELQGFEGWALFIDCDFIALEDVNKLFNQIDDKYALMCVKHDYSPRSRTKMDGKNQYKYPRKNWSSMMLINCGHPSNKKLTKELVNDPQVDGQYLHRFSWLKDEEIGDINREWNWLVNWYKEPVDGHPKLLHFTEGSPWFEEYKDCEYSEEYHKIKREINNE